MYEIFYLNFSILDSLFRPFPFIGVISHFQKSFYDEINKSRPDKSVLIQKIKQQAKSLEESYPSLSNTYENLLAIIRDEFDYLVKDSKRFDMLPIIGAEKYYAACTTASDFSTIPPNQLFNYLEENFSALDDKNLPQLVKYGLSPSTYPLAKLSIIDNLILQSFEFDIDQDVKKVLFLEEGGEDNTPESTIRFTKFIKIPDHPIEKWGESSKITKLINMSPNKTIYINSLGGQYIVFDNSKGRYIIDIISKKYKFKNEEFKNLNEIIDNKYILKNAAIVNGQLMLIVLENYEVCIISFQNDEMPTKSGEGDVIETGLSIAYSGTCLHVIYDKLHVYTNQSDIVVYDLAHMTIVQEYPQYYIYSMVNFSNNKIFGISYNNKEIFVDIRKKQKSDRYLSVVRPCFAIQSLVVVSFIIDDILMEVTNCFISLVETGKAQSFWAANSSRHIEYILRIIKRMENVNCDNDLKNFLYLMLDRLLILNLRQMYSTNKAITDEIKTKTIAFFGKQIPIDPVKDNYDMLIRTVKYGIYWPLLVNRIHEDYLRYTSTPIFDIFKLPQSIFLPFDVNLINYLSTEEERVDFINQRINDMYLIIKQIGIKNGNTKKFFFDKEFINFVKFVFEYVNMKKSHVVLQLFSLLSVIPMGPYLTLCVSDELYKISESDLIFKMFHSNKGFMKYTEYLLNFGTNERVEEKLSSISLNTTIFSPENICGDIETVFLTPFDKIRIKQKDFVKGQVNQNAFFNYEELNSEEDTTYVDGHNLSIDIIGNNKSTQYLLDGIVSRFNSDDLQYIHRDCTKFSLLIYLYSKCAKISREAIPPTGMEETYKDILNLPVYDKNNETLYTFNDELRSIVRNSKIQIENTTDIFTIIAMATTNQVLLKKKDTFAAMNKEVQELPVKIALSVIWTCNYMNEFNEFKKNPSVKSFEGQFKKILPKIRKIKGDLIQFKTKDNFDSMISSINKKFFILMESVILNEPTTEERDKRFERIIKFYSFDLDNHELMKIENLRRLKRDLPSKVNESIKRLIIKLYKLKKYPFAIPFARSLIQEIDYDLFNSDDKERLKKFNDIVIISHMIHQENDDKNIVELTKIISEERCETCNNELVMAKKVLGNIGLALVNISKLQNAIPLMARDDENSMLVDLGYRAFHTSNYWQVADEACHIRSTINPKNIVDKINFQEFDAGLGAMVALGAEIYDSEITRYIKVRGETKLAIDCDVDLQRNAQSCFEVDPPKFIVTDNLIKQMIEYINTIDMITDDKTKALSNCIILSFMTKMFEAVPDKEKFGQKFKKLASLVRKYNDKKVPNFSNSKYCFIIRQHFDRCVNKNGLAHRFVPLTHFQECDEKCLRGSSEASSFFVHTKQLDTDHCIRISFNQMRTQLKYVGFISEDWECTVLSLLDRNIYMDKKFIPYTDSSSEILLWMDGSFLCFGNVKINSGETKKRWVFIITVFDNSLISYEYLTRENSFKAAEIPPKQHNFDISQIFPKVCIGMRGKIEGRTKFKVSKLTDPYLYLVEGFDIELGFSVQYHIPAHQITTEYTPFDSIMLCAEMVNGIGVSPQLLNTLLESCQNYSISLIQNLVPYYSNEINSAMTLSEITKLTETSSKAEIDRIKEMMVGREGELRAELEEIVMKGESDSSFTVCRDINQLYNSEYGSAQIGLFQAWNHSLFYKKSFINGLELFSKYKKICLGFIPMILKEFNFNQPSDLGQAKMILNFFNSPNNEAYFDHMTAKNCTEYFNNLVTYIFEREPQMIVTKQPHSTLINRCAESLIPNLFELGKKQENKEKRMPPLLLFSDRGAVFSKSVYKHKNFYPVEILLHNGSTKLLQSNSNYEENKGYRYHFGTNGNQVLNDWKLFVEKDFSDVYKPLLLDYLLKNKIADKRIGDYPPIVVFFACIGLSTLREIDDSYFDYFTPEMEPIYEMINRNIKIGYLSDFEEWAEKGEIGYLYIDVKRTHSQGVPYDSPQLVKVIDYLAKDEAHFPSNLIAFKEASNKLMYFVKYENSSGQDVGGMFRDSFLIMVNELMDVNIRYFIKPPNTLHCEREKLVPAPNMPPKIAYTIGAVLSSAIATKYTQKAWNIPRFIWDSFVTDEKLSNLVDCDDPSYFSSLEKIIDEMRRGFWEVIPLKCVRNFSGRFIEGLSCGNKAEMDLNTFLNYFTRESVTTSVWPVFMQAISTFTSEELSKLMAFITGNDTPRLDRNFSMKLVEISPNGDDETRFQLPKAHTCFFRIDVMPYKSAEVLRQKLKICITCVSEFEDEDSPCRII